MSDSVLAVHVKTTRPDESDFFILIGIETGAVVFGAVDGEV